MVPVNDACIKLVKEFEGCKLKAYHGPADRPDVFTIGYGVIQYPPDYMGGKMVALSDPEITQEQADGFLRYHLMQKAALIDPLLRDDLNENQCGALVSFAYNLGEYALKTSTLRMKVNFNPMDKTITNEFARWVHSNGQVQPGLVRRRAREAQLYFTKV